MEQPTPTYWGGFDGLNPVSDTESMLPQPPSLPQPASSSTIGPPSRPRRPCDACRRRKSRCEIAQGESDCILCKFHHQTCKFDENPQPRKRRKVSESRGENGAMKMSSDKKSVAPLDPSADSVAITRPANSSLIRLDTPIDDYANLKGPSLLKKTLGLQNHRHIQYVGATSVFDASLLDIHSEELSLGPVSIRKVAENHHFLLVPDSTTTSHEDEIRDVDQVESLVAPHGPELISLYFRIVHASYPILHKQVFLEKYHRSHREFSPPLLAAVYLLATNWWRYSAKLSSLSLPDLSKLEALALKTWSYVICRPKLSTIQAGLLLLQRPEGQMPTFAMTGQLVALAQDLGLHLDCSNFRIPAWERGLRKRLAFATYQQQLWAALTYSRPILMSRDDWAVKPLVEADFPEQAADEDDEDGSTGVVQGRMLFCEMIKLSEILERILRGFYSLRMQEELRQRDQEGAGVRHILDRVKPIQIQLKEWCTKLPDCLKLGHVGLRKLSSSGYLYLAYYAAEIALHRRIVSGLKHETDVSLINVCRRAAHTRLVSATEFVKALQPQHLQSFWFGPSKYLFCSIASFIGLLLSTSRTREEAERYLAALEDYRWNLRLASKSAEIIEKASGMVDLTTGPLIKSWAEQEDALAKSESERESWEGGEADEQEVPIAGEFNDPSDWVSDQALSTELSEQTSPAGQSELSDAMLEAIWEGLSTNSVVL